MVFTHFSSDELYVSCFCDSIVIAACAIGAVCNIVMATSSSVDVDGELQGLVNIAVDTLVSDSSHSTFSARILLKSVIQLSDRCSVGDSVLVSLASLLPSLAGDPYNCLFNWLLIPSSRLVY